MSLPLFFNIIMEECIFVEKWDCDNDPYNPCYLCKDVIKVEDSLRGELIVGCKLNKKMYYTKYYSNPCGFTTYGWILKSF